MFTSNMKILTLNTKTNSPIAQTGGGAQANIKESINNGNESSIVGSGNRQGGAEVGSNLNHKQNKREQKHNKTKFIQGNNSKMQQQYITHQQQKYHHNNNINNTGGNKLKKHYNNSNSNTNTTTSLNRKKYYHQQTQQHHQQHYQQQQQYLTVMQQSKTNASTITTCNDSNSVAVKSQKYINIDLQNQEQQQHTISNNANSNFSNHTKNQTYTCLTRQNNCDKSLYSPTPFTSTSSVSAPAAVDLNRYENNLKIANVNDPSKTLPLSNSQQTTPTKIATLTTSARNSCWVKSQAQASTLSNFNPTSNNLQAFVTSAVEAAVASKSNSNQKLTRTSSSSSSITLSSTTTTTSNAITTSLSKKKSFWKNSKTGESAEEGCVEATCSLSSSGYSSCGSVIQSPKTTKDKLYASDRNLVINTLNNNKNFNNSNGRNIQKYSATVAGAHANTTSQLNKELLKHQVHAVKQTAMTTTLTGSNSSATTENNLEISYTSNATIKQQQDTLDKHSELKQMSKLSATSNGSSSSNNVENKTNSNNSTASTSPTSSNSYSLDFLHKVGRKLSVGLRPSKAQETTSCYDNQTSTNSPINGDSYPYTYMTSQRQPRYIYGGSGHNYHHQPTQLTIASFLQKDFLSADNSLSNANNNNNSSSVASGPFSNTRNFNDHKQHQQHYAQQQQPTHSRFHHNFYTTSHQQQPSGIQHPSYGGGSGVFGGELGRFASGGRSGGQFNSGYSYTNHHKNDADSVGMMKKSSLSQQHSRQLVNTNYTNSGNSSQSHKKSSNVSSTTSNSTSSNPSNTFSRQLTSTSTGTSQESNNTASNLNLAIETLPAKTLGAANQRINHRIHHHSNHSHHHQHHNYYGYHHHQHVMMNSPNMLQHQNYNNLTYVSTDGPIGGTTSRGCSPAPQSMPPTPLTATNSHSPKPMDNNSPGPIAMLMNFNTSHLPYPPYANVQHHFALQPQYQHQQQQQNLLNKKLLAPLTLTMPSPTPSPTPATNSSITALNPQNAPPPHNIISCSQLDEATTAAAAATAASTTGIIAGNDYDSEASSNHSTVPNKYPLQSSSSLSSSASSTSLSLTGQQLQQQNCSQPTTPATCGPPTSLSSPMDYNYNGISTHAFPNVHVIKYLAPQQNYKTVNETQPQIYANNTVASLLSFPKKSPNYYTDDGYQQQQQPHQYYFNTIHGQSSSDHSNIVPAITADATHSSNSSGYWSPLHQNNQFLYQQTTLGQVSLMPPNTTSSSSSCGSSINSISPRLLTDEIHYQQQTQQQVHSNFCQTNASPSPSPCSSCHTDKYNNIIIDSNLNTDSVVLPAGLNSSESGINSSNGEHNYPLISSSQLIAQQQRLIAHQQQQSSLCNSSSSTLASSIRPRGDGAGGVIHPNNGRNQIPLSQSSIASSMVNGSGSGQQQLPPPPPLTQHIYSHHQQQALPHPLPPHNLIFNNPQIHHMRPFSNPSINSSVHDYFPYSTPPDRFLARAHLVEVKETPATLLNNSKWDHLSQDIWTKFTTSQQTEETFKKKMHLWRYLYVVIKNAYPRYGLYLVGSTISGFGSDSSDIDMCLVCRNTSHYDPRTDAIFNLTVLRDCISKSGEFENFNLIEAKVPILRFRDRVHHIEFDLNFNNGVGIKNTHLLYCYSQLDWRLRPLVLVTKLWAQYHNINNAKTRTISSYSLVLMVIHFLQCAVNPPVLPCLHEIFPEKFTLLRSNDFGYVDLNETLGPYETKNTQTLGELFLDFLQYYSCFHFTDYAISVRTGGLLPVNLCRVAKSLKNDIHQWKELNIEEPFDLTNTARSVYDFETFSRVKEVFVKSWMALRDTLDLNSVFSPLPENINDIEIQCYFNASNSKNILEQYVNAKDFNPATNAAVAEKSKDFNKNTSICEEKSDIILEKVGDESDDNWENTVIETSTNQKVPKNIDLDRTLTPHQHKTTYIEKNNPTSLKTLKSSPSSSSSKTSSSLACIRSSTKNFNKSNNNKTAASIKS